MTIKLALLKSGEEVISDIDEMITDKQVVVGYYFTNPCRAMLTTPDISPQDSSERQPVSIKLIFQLKFFFSLLKYFLIIPPLYPKAKKNSL